MSRLLVLMYHIIDEPKSKRENKVCCTPRSFKSQIEYLLKSGYEFLTLKQVESWIIKRSPIPTKSVLITFDDGFECFWRNALPILENHRIPASVFVLPGMFSGENKWMSKNDYPARALMSKEQIVDSVLRGIDFGSHSLSHPHLNAISVKECITQVVESKRLLQELMGKEISCFAYPHGDYNDFVKATVKEAGYKVAFSTKSGFNSKNIDPYEVRRIDVYGNDKFSHFKRKIKLGSNNVTNMDMVRYYIKRIRSK